MEKRRWHAIYTKPRWEKKVHTLLQQNGIESYCPLNKVRRKWSDRIKTVEEPVFKSYVFVRLNDLERTAVRTIDGVVNFVYWLGKPALIKDKEIETIKKFLNEYEVIEAKPTTLPVNAKVKIDQGPFMNMEATVVKVINKKVELKIDSIGFTLIAYIDRVSLATSPPKKSKTKKSTGDV